MTAADFDDSISFDSAGVLRYLRRSGGALRRLGLAGAALLEDSGTGVLACRAGAGVVTCPPLQADYSPDGKSLAVQTSGTLSGELRLLAPLAEQITLNGAAVAFRKDGDYRVIATGSAPVWGAAVNAASFAPALASGALFSIFGTNLALATASAPALPLPLELAGIRVLVNGAPVPLLYASPLQINAQLPPNLSLVPAQVMVAGPSGTTGPQAISVAAVAPGIFTASRSTTHLTIYATGLGPVAPAIPAGSPAGASPLSRCTLPVTVSMGGKDAPVTYAGLAPGLAGVYQVNAQLPAGLPAGPLPVTVTVAGTASNTITLP